MRRSAAALGLTVVGLWLILTFKSSPASHARLSRCHAAAPQPRPPRRPPTPRRGRPAAGLPPAPAPTTAAGGSGRTVTGGVFTNRYGPVQVAVVARRQPDHRRQGAADAIRPGPVGRHQQPGGAAAARRGHPGPERPDRHHRRRDLHQRCHTPSRCSPRSTRPMPESWPDPGVPSGGAGDGYRHLGRRARRRRRPDGARRRLRLVPPGGRDIQHLQGIQPDQPPGPGGTHHRPM